MSGVEVVASACVRKGALDKAGCGLEVYLYTVDSFDPEDEELIYSQATVDALRAQLEAAERVHTALVDRAERAEAECRTLKRANIAYSQRVSELTGRAGNAEARAEAAEAECARTKRDIVDIYEAMPMLPITEETMNAATDWFARYCVDFYREINAAQDAAARTKEQQA